VKDTQEQIDGPDGRVHVIGLGYVVLSRGSSSPGGFVVRGIDIDLERVTQLNRGQSYLVDVATETIAPLVAKGGLPPPPPSMRRAGGRPHHLRPHPLREEQGADISFIVASSRVSPPPASGPAPFLESTTFPGTTKRSFQPRLESVGLVVGPMSSWPSPPSASTR